MDLIDTSTLSLFVGFVLFVVSGAVIKYVLDNRNKNLPESERIDSFTYSVIGAILTALLGLICYKQFIMYRANNEILNESFYD
jgi:ABC-type Fe3+ transport system permease subunit